MLLPGLMLTGAIITLFFGAELSLDASEKIGKKLGMSPLMIGILLVGLGTSLPEFFVGHIAGMQGKMSIAVGSLVGSNIANMFLVLGITGFFVKMDLASKVMRKQLLLHFLLGIILCVVLTRASFNILSSVPLLFLCGVFLYTLMKGFTKEEGGATERLDYRVTMFKLCVGFAMLYLGGEMLVKSASEICLVLGLSEYIVSSIFIAFGTSFPELVTSLLAAFKKKDTDLIIGNIVGSNVFNCAFILASLGIYNFSLNDNYTHELVALVLGALILLALSFFNKSFYKKAGFLFLLGYMGVIGHWLSFF